MTHHITYQVAKQRVRDLHRTGDHQRLGPHGHQPSGTREQPRTDYRLLTRSAAARATPLDPTRSTLAGSGCEADAPVPFNCRSCPVLRIAASTVAGCLPSLTAGNGWADRLAKRFEARVSPEPSDAVAPDAVEAVDVGVAAGEQGRQRRTDPRGRRCLAAVDDRGALPRAMTYGDMRLSLTSFRSLDERIGRAG
jgi:hypothetical protein